MCDNEKLTTKIIDVKNFGAVGDGETDDTMAILNAIEFARQNDGFLYFPQGRLYKVSKDIKVSI